MHALQSENLIKHQHELTVSYRDLNALKVNKRNARIHSRTQINQIASSIKEFGFTNPVLVDEQHVVIAGHGRVAAAGSLGIKSVPAIQISGLTDAEKRALMLADNKIALNAGWDTELLKVELESLSTADLDFDVTVTGFATAEIDSFISEVEDCAANAADEIPPIDRSQPPVSRLGDVWHIGKHILVCGNALDAKTYQSLLGTKKADLVFTDPPYNVPIVGHVSGKGKIKHGEFAMASGELSRAEFIAFLGRAFQNLVEFSKDGSIHFICMDWRHMQEMLEAGNTHYTELKNLCVWAKTNAGMGSLYRSQHELVFVYKNGTKPHTNNVELGRFGRNRTNLWTYAGANAFGLDRQAELALHPTVKPISLVADAIRDCSGRNGIILDPFAGVGTALLASERTGRQGRGIELDSYYVDATIRRFQDTHDLYATLLGSERTFEEIATARKLEG